MKLIDRCTTCEHLCYIKKEVTSYPACYKIEAGIGLSAVILKPEEFGCIFYSRKEKTNEN